jgi:hypothetical protein
VYFSDVFPNLFASWERTQPRDQQNTGECDTNKDVRTPSLLLRPGTEGALGGDGLFARNHYALASSGRALAVYPARAATPTAADGFINLFAVVVYGTEEYPAPKTEGAVALLLVLLVLIYTDGALPLRQTLLVRRPLRYLWARSRGV